MNWVFVSHSFMTCHSGPPWGSARAAQRDRDVFGRKSIAGIFRPSKLVYATKRPSANSSRGSLTRAQSTRTFLAPPRWRRSRVGWTDVECWYRSPFPSGCHRGWLASPFAGDTRSEEHTSELQSRLHL